MIFFTMFVDRKGTKRNILLATTGCKKQRWNDILLREFLNRCSRHLMRDVCRIESRNLEIHGDGAMCMTRDYIANENNKPFHIYDNAR